MNGKSLPTFDVQAGEPYRLRLINTSNARVLEIDPARFGAQIMGYDGQLLASSQTLGYAPLLVGPAQHVDLLVVPEAGKDFALEEV